MWLHLQVAAVAYSERWSGEGEGERLDSWGA